MTCGTCGALVGTLDASCGSCGAEITTAAVTTLPAPPEGRAASTTEAVPDEALVPERAQAPEQPATPARRPRARRARSVTVLAVVAVVLLITAIAVAVSRQQVASRLGTTTSERDVARSQVGAATSHATELENQLDQLRAAQAQLDHVRALQQDQQASLKACQEVFRVGARYPNFSAVPPAVATQLASNLVSCFEGKVPPSLFG